MAFVPTLDDKAKGALRIILDKGVVSGWELSALAGLKGQELVETVRRLLDDELISASGNTSHPDTVLEAYFNFRPSARPLANFYLRFGA